MSQTYQLGGSSSVVIHCKYCINWFGVSNVCFNHRGSSVVCGLQVYQLFYCGPLTPHLHHIEHVY